MSGGSSDAAADLFSAARREIDATCDRFEAAWKAGREPDIRDFLAPADRLHATASQQDILVELVKIDLEYRWRPSGDETLSMQTHSSQTAPLVEKLLPSRPCLEHYVARYPQLGPLTGLPASLIAAEYRLRRRGGERPERDDFLARFGHRPELAAMLDQIDGTQADQDKTLSPISPTAVSAVASLTLQQFIERLTAGRLLSAADISAVEEHLAAEALPKDAPSLADALRRAGKLTEYQLAAVTRGDTTGLVMGEYVVLDKLGAGGMGQVFKARHRAMKRLVALKVLSARLVDSPEAVQRFHHEVEAAARLIHPNIVIAHDAGEYEGTHYLVMEYIDGHDLAWLLKQNGRLPIAVAVDYVLQAARGLQYAHEQGIIHRDIKPGNLLVDKHGVVKILDMGLARVERRALLGESTGTERLTESGQVMGTLDYMAPEQALDTHTADARSDVYSLGCTLYRLLAGKSPYHGETFTQVFAAHLNAPVPTLSEARPDVPPELDAVFRKMLAKRPEGRYQSMAEVVAALEAVQGSGFGVQGSGGPQSPPTAVGGLRGLRQRIGSWPPRRRIVVAALTMLPVFFALGVVLWINRTRVEVPDGSEVRVNADGSVGVTLPVTKPEAPPPPRADTLFDRHRRAAEAVLRLGGKVTLLTAARDLAVATIKDLPTEPFALRQISLTRQPGVRDIDLRTLSGVHCVETLELEGTSISDAGLKELGGLDIWSLNLNKTAVSDAGIASLSVRKDLGVLNLSKDRVSSHKITDAACAHLRQLPRVQCLRMAGADMGERGWAELAGLRSLRVLEIGRDLTARGLATLRVLPDLHELIVTDGSVGDDWLDVLSQFPQLRIVDLKWAACPDTLAVRLQKALPNAAVFHPAVPATEGERRAVQWLLDNKASVQERYGRGIDAAYLKSRQGAFLVNKVDMPRNGPTSGAANLRGLRGITVLSWQGLRDADAEASHLATLRTLLGLWLPFSDLSDAGIQRLADLDQLLTLSLNGCPNISDRGMAHLATLKYVYRLQLGTTSVGDEGLRHLGRIQGLRQLDLELCKNVTSEGMKHLTQLPVLRELRLTATSIDDGAIKYLAQMASLRILNLCGTKVTAAGVEELRRALPKCVIFWDPSRDAAPPALSPASDTPPSTLPTPPSTLRADTLFDRHRRAAEAVLKLGGAITVRTSRARDLPVTSLKGLPAAPFVLYTVSFERQVAVLDADLKELTGIHYLGRLDLSGTSITDIGLRQLDNVDIPYIDLGNTSISDAAMPRLSARKDLLALRVGKNPGSQHQITDGACIHLKQLSRLRSLRLLPTDMTDRGLSELAGLRSLRTLQVGGSFTAKGLLTLRTLPNLQCLVLDTKSKVDELFDILPQFPQLRTIDLYSLAACPTALVVKLQKALPNARVFHRAIPAPETERKSLRWLLDNKVVAKGPLGRANEVTYREVPQADFHVHRVIVPDTGPSSGAANLRGLSALEFLLWTNLKNADAEAEHIASLRTLTTLYLTRPDLSDAGIQRLANLGQLETLAIVDCGNVTDRRLEYLTSLNHLVWLTIERTPIGQGGMAHLGRIESLQQLEASSCPNLTSEGLKHLTRLPVLRSLNVSGTSIDDDAVKYLRQMGCLRIVNLCDTKVTAAGVEELRRALPKCAVFWDDPQGPVPSPSPSASNPPTSSTDTGSAVPPLAVAPFDGRKAQEHQQVWAKHLGAPVEQTNSIGMKLVLVPPGEFDMGSTPKEIDSAIEDAKNHRKRQPISYLERILSEGPRHWVRISHPFYLGRYEVTQAEYLRVMGTDPIAFPAKGMNAEKGAVVAGGDTSRNPVESVSWDDAVEFCRKLSASPQEHAAGRTYWVPTEAQWEYACRAGTTAEWCSGDERTVSDYAWHGDNSDRKVHPVGQKKPNAWGLYDMHGNVWEWCRDFFGQDYYRVSPGIDPKGPPSGPSRVFRSGSWQFTAYPCRSACRIGAASTSRFPDLGFRVLCTATTTADNAAYRQPDAQSPAIIGAPVTSLPPPAGGG